MAVRKSGVGTPRRAKARESTILAPGIGTPAVGGPDMGASAIDPKGQHLSGLGGQLVDEGEIGAGGTSSVRKAYDPRLRRLVATKMLSPALANNPEQFRCFVEEARVMAQLDHPNIVPVHDLVVQGGDTGGNTAYIVMKLVRGQTLEEMVQDGLKRGPGVDQLHELLAIFLKVCDALAFAHSRRVIHCDLKPSNIMVGEYGQAYLMDWGIASQRSDRLDAPALGARKRTRGTPAYMSPEQAAGQAEIVGERTDIFGLGAVLYFILTGRAPFRADTVTASLARAKAGVCDDIDEASRIPPPPGLSRIVRRAMAPNPADRPGSVLELRNSVELLLRGDWSLPTSVFAPGKVIVAEGDWADVAYIIVRGRCAVSKIIDGQKRLLRTLEPGAVFGETGILSGDVRTATVEAVSEVMVKVVTRELFRDQLGGDTWLGKFVVALADRFRELDAKVPSRKPDPSTG